MKWVEFVEINFLKNSYVKKKITQAVSHIVVL